MSAGQYIALAALVALSAAAGTKPPAVTFDKEVLPIFQKRCQDCHRPGEAAPMPLITYQDARPWAKAIREAVLTKKMPPWFADPHFGKFSNDRSLSQAEIDTIVQWVDSGGLEGNPKDAPAPRHFVDGGWTIGKPDLVLEMPDAFDVPATGLMEYRYVILPTGLTEDRWVRATEIRPGNRAVMHHVIASVREPGSTWFSDQKPGVLFVPRQTYINADFSQGMANYIPGQELSQATDDGPRRAVLLKAGSDIVLQLHYAPNGTATKDKTRIGIIFDQGPPARRSIPRNAALIRFTIPAGAPDYRLEAVTTLPYDCELLNMTPHAHLRAKSFEYRILRPDGTAETVLSVPKYDFNWQITYSLETPLHLAKGTKVQVIAHYDNSVNNAHNPDPLQNVHWGEQTTDEMLMGYFNVEISPNSGPR